MPRVVLRDEIDSEVVRNWCRLMSETAKDRGHNLSNTQPFFPLSQTYPEVMREVRTQTPEGVEHYRGMVRFLPGYVLEDN